MLVSTTKHSIATLRLGWPAAANRADWTTATQTTSAKL